MPKPVAAVSLAALLLAPPHALAEPAAAAWQVTPRIEYSDVVINGRDAQWRSTGVTVERATAPGDAVFATLERQDRDGTGDDSLQLGVYRRCRLPALADLRGAGRPCRGAEHARRPGLPPAGFQPRRDRHLVAAAGPLPR